MILMENRETHEEWLSNDEAAEFLKISTKTLKRYRDFKYIPYSKGLRKVMFKKSDLLAYLNKNYNQVQIEN